MATNWPYSEDIWADKVDNVDLIMASHVNNMQDAIMALEREIHRTYRPDLKPPAPSAYDDEFESGVLDPAWTPLNCALGTVDLVYEGPPGGGIYDPTTYRGMIGMQARLQPTTRLRGY